MIVVDASALVELLLQTQAAAFVGERIRKEKETLHAPHLLDLEVAQVLRRYVRRREISSERCRTALQDLVEFPLIRHPHVILLDRIWELRDSVTAYDAAYVSLAEALDAPLLTRDERLAAAPGHSARIELI